MRTLEPALENYLNTRRALGFRLYESERLLTQFVAFVKVKQSGYITAEMALDFAKNCRATPTRWAKRFGIVRLFCRYVHAIDPRTPLLPDRVFRRSDGRARPYIFSENDIYRLVEACKTITLGKLRNATYSTLLGLIAVTGIRVGEAMKLEDRDVDWAERILTIREAKFNKSRQVVLHPSTVDELRRYQRLRNQLRPVRNIPNFFIGHRGGPVDHVTIHGIFVRALKRIGLEKQKGGVNPRIHCLRHSFAVNTLIRWYRDGHDVEQRIPLLSTYMGHISPSSTYWYLSAVPELMALAASRLEKQLGGVA
jgi:integrase/recombinase XerD